MKANDLWWIFAVIGSVAALYIGIGVAFTMVKNSLERQTDELCDTIQTRLNQMDLMLRSHCEDNRRILESGLSELKAEKRRQQMTTVMYPTAFPSVQLLSCASILRNGELAAKKSRFAKDVYHCQGYAQKQWLGDPDAGDGEIERMTEGIESPPGSDVECADRIESMIASQKEADAHGAAWQLPLAKLLPLVVYLLKRAIEHGFGLPPSD